MLVPIVKQHVPGYESAVAVGTAYVPFKPTRLIVPPSIAPDFELESLVIGMIEFLSAGPGTIAADAFVWVKCEVCGAEAASGCAKIEFGDFLVDAGMSLRLYVKSRNGASRDFLGALEGVRVPR